MITQYHKFALTATLGLVAMAFIFSCSSDGGGGGGSFGGGKGNDIKNYKTVVIGSQTWMAENLNYNVNGSRCLGEGGQVMVVSIDEESKTETITYTTLSNAEIQDNCNKYGRLYSWATAMALPSNCNSSSCVSKISVKHRGICPSGWHIPSDDDWEQLIEFAGGKEIAGNKLKATNGWEHNNGNCTNDYKFSALSGGYFGPDGLDGDISNVYFPIGYRSIWWSSTEFSASIAHNRYLKNKFEGVGMFSDAEKSFLFSVRCLLD